MYPMLISIVHEVCKSNARECKNFFLNVIESIEINPTVYTCIIDLILKVTKGLKNSSLLFSFNYMGDL